jgi:hypothetical protein
MEASKEQRQSQMSAVSLRRARVGIGASFLVGAAVGSALMYFLDPRTGAYRRSIARDRISGTSRTAATTTGKRFRHLRNQLGGLVVASTEWLRSPAADSDRKIADRIRTRLGRVTHHMNAVAVEVRDGQVLLSGRLPDEEALRVVSETSQIQGVKGVKDEIRRYSQEQQPAAGAEQAA